MKVKLITIKIEINFKSCTKHKQYRIICQNYCQKELEREIFSFVIYIYLYIHIHICKQIYKYNKYRLHMKSLFRKCNLNF